MCIFPIDFIYLQTIYLFTKYRHSSKEFTNPVVFSFHVTMDGWNCMRFRIKHTAMNTYCTSFFFRKRIKEKWKKRKIYIYRSEGRSWSLNDLIKFDIMGVSHYDTKVMITLKSSSFCHHKIHYVPSCQQQFQQSNCKDSFRNECECILYSVNDSYKGCFVHLWLILNLL